MLRVELVRMHMHLARGRTAVAGVAAQRLDRRALHAAAADARAVARFAMPCAAPYAALLRAGIARNEGAPSQAVAELEVAARGFSAASMAMFAAFAERGRARLASDAAAVAAADATLRELGAVDLDRMEAMLAPALA